MANSSYKEITPLGQGKVAMQLSGSWAMGQLKSDYPEKVNDIGFAVCPTRDGVTEGVTTAALGGWGFSMDGKAAHPEEAGKFIEWLHSLHLISSQLILSKNSDFPNSPRARA